MWILRPQDHCCNSSWDSRDLNNLSNSNGQSRERQLRGVFHELTKQFGVAKKAYKSIWMNMHTIYLYCMFHNALMSHIATAFPNVFVCKAYLL